MAALRRFQSCMLAAFQGHLRSSQSVITHNARPSLCTIAPARSLHRYMFPENSFSQWRILNNCCRLFGCRTQFSLLQRGMATKKGDFISYFKPMLILRT